MTTRKQHARGLYAKPRAVRRALDRWLDRPDLSYDRIGALILEKFKFKVSTTALSDYRAKREKARLDAATPTAETARTARSAKGQTLHIILPPGCRVRLVSK